MNELTPKEVEAIRELEDVKQIFAQRRDIKNWLELTSIQHELNISKLTIFRLNHVEEGMLSRKLSNAIQFLAY